MPGLSLLTASQVLNLDLQDNGNNGWCVDGWSVKHCVHPNRIFYLYSWNFYIGLGLGVFGLYFHTKFISEFVALIVV